MYYFRSFTFRETILLYRKTESASKPSLDIYNKACGVRYWQKNENFANKHDILFFFVLSSILDPAHEEIIIIEFGANVGQFSEVILATPHEIPYVVHSIEPVISLFQTMTNRSSSFRKQKHDKHFLHNIAISDRTGRVPIYTHAPDKPGEASTLGQGSRLGYRFISEVSVTTLPMFIKTNHIKTPISFVKIDVEGFEPEVIRGMNLTLNSALFPLFLFETGGAWRDDRSVLARTHTIKSFVRMLDILGYDCFYVGSPYLLPITGKYWDDSFEDIPRSCNILSVLRISQTWKNLATKLAHIPLNSCQWL
ncbi:unnamed protein product [Adineta ricciae]|uniref:Methyltransferase FkbM domain-containing protein n=1 Tax=Adineta ricciae TaxID=249248 RepID=A0A815QZ58_ADIRI|nr:unnamed protein product [Adineta ricciae]